MTMAGKNDDIRALLSGVLEQVVDAADDGPFASDQDYLNTLEALTTLEVIAYKLALECQQRVLSFASRDFGDAAASSVQRAMLSLPRVREWVGVLRKRLAVRGSLPLPTNGLKPRFVRTCEVYELSETEVRIFGALLMMRSSHAFTSVKLGTSIGYGRRSRARARVHREWAAGLGGEASAWRRGERRVAS